MFDLSKADGMEKASRSIGGALAKQAEELAKTQARDEDLSKQHDLAATTHEGLKKAHEDSAALHRAAIANMDDSHELYAYHKASEAIEKRSAEMEEKIATAHKAMSAAYKTSAESAKATVDSLKAVAAEWGGVAVTVKSAATAVTKVAGADPAAIAAGTVNELMEGTMTKLLAKTFETLESSPEVQKRIEDIVLKAIGEKLGDKMVPSNVSVINRGANFMVPRAGTTVARTGTDDAPVAPQLAKIVAMDD